MRPTPLAVAAAVALAVPLLLAPAAGAAPAPDRSGPHRTGVVREVVVEGPRGGVEHVVASGTDLLRLDVPVAGGSTVRFRQDGERVVDVDVLARPARPAVTAGTTAPLAHVVHLVRALNPGQAPDESLSVAALRDAVDRAGAYWARESGGAVTFRVGRVVSDWVRLTSPCTDSGPTMEAGLKAAQLPVDVPRGQHVVVVTPYDGTCLGYGTVGTDVHDGGAVVVGAGGALADTEAVLPVSGLAHELGHNISLDHASAVHCPGTVADPALPSLAGCDVREYGDGFDVMGPSGTEFGRGSLGVINRVRLGLGDVTRLVGAGLDTTVVIDSLSRSTGRAHGVAVTAPDGQTYWVDHRTDWGGDRVFGELAGSGSTGVRISRPHPTMARRLLVLDLVRDGRLPAQEGVDDYLTLPTGTTFTSRTGQLRISVAAADTRTATIRLQTAPFPDAAGPAPGTRPATGDPTAPQDPADAPAAPPATDRPRLLLSADRPAPFGPPVYATVLGMPGARVDLYSRLFPNTSFTRIRAGLLLGPDGSVVVETQPNRNLRLLARYAVDGAPSGQPLVQVATVTSLSSVTFSGGRVVFRGSSKPARAGQVVEIREGPRVLGRASTSATGVYAVSLVPPGGCRTVRAVSVRTGYNEASESGSGRLCS